MTERTVELILGGARSGKSRAGETRLLGFERPVIVATAEPLDEEMTARIARHRADRDPRIETREVPLDLVEALAAAGARAVLVDCLTLWLSNLMHHGRDPDVETARLVGALAEAEGPRLLVSNEVGLGLVPETPLGRAFRDAQGRLNQRVAAVATRVTFMAAGLPLVLKAPPEG